MKARRYLMRFGNGQEKEKLWQTNNRNDFTNLPIKRHKKYFANERTIK